MNISVCIATYNGGKFILEQITSILEQLKSDDEVIVVDDCSRDDTVQILQKLNDSRIKIFLNDQNRSHVFSFNRAISLANNDIVFMSDQDDLWMKGRVAIMMKKLIHSGHLLVTSNTEFMDIYGNKIDYHVDGVHSNTSSKNLKNILAIFVGKTNYFGCTMAFRRKLTDLILPIPSFVESHDLWIALAGNLIGSNLHLDEKTLIRRVHDNNASIIQRRVLPKVWSRFIFWISIIVLLSRLRNFKREK